jgi:hypothetical protein
MGISSGGMQTHIHAKKKNLHMHVLVSFMIAKTGHAQDILQWTNH